MIFILAGAAIDSFGIAVAITCESLCTCVAHGCCCWDAAEQCQVIADDELNAGRSTLTVG